MVSISPTARTVGNRDDSENRVTRIAVSALPTAHGDFRAVAYHDDVLGVDHVALVLGDLNESSTVIHEPSTDGQRRSAQPDPVLARLHSECLTGEAFASRRCDCGAQLDRSLDMITQTGRGVLVYLRGHEGRGIGLAAKIAAYALQDRGQDTLDANLSLGHPADAREYGAGAAILADLGVSAVRLLTNNPDKVAALRGHGVEVVDRVPLTVPADPVNLGYLRTKRDRMRHLLPQLDAPRPTASEHG
ncbi:GTP cyclohydrolase II [Pseudonocardia humida]|uniref:GTP cyclohydrolase-2 n=1 Tax=Pseudonocardia humida TaxID=2800819 RepID=A0ABT0ZUL7_9PSEU|nr:GTP cyclohydrolase II [Pseudonocardia humida]MCO1654426.1 GTP cyclohydrolase II [Pseudonocardia humida]